MEPNRDSLFPTINVQFTETRVLALSAFLSFLPSPSVSEATHASAQRSSFSSASGFDLPVLDGLDVLGAATTVVAVEYLSKH